MVLRGSEQFGPKGSVALGFGGHTRGAFPAEIIGYEEGAEWTNEEVRWDPENYDVDVVYENIKNAVITVYAGIAECRMRYKFDKE